MTLRITYVGHATLLLEMGGVRVLTDPNFDRRLGGVLPRTSAVSLPGEGNAEELPDAVLLTHAHADHLSFASLAHLVQRAGGRAPPPVYAPPGVARWLARRGYPAARPAEPGDRLSLAHDLVVHVGRATHSGSRYGVDRWGGRGAANTYLIDAGSDAGSDGATAFFAGDTGLRPDSHDVVAQQLWGAGRRLDVALLPIGYAPWWKPRFRRGHLSGADALTLFERLDARLLVPYHWGTFHHLTSGPFDALRQLEPVLARHPRRADVRIVPPGGVVEYDR